MNLVAALWSLALTAGRVIRLLGEGRLSLSYKDRSRQGRPLSLLTWEQTVRLAQLAVEGGWLDIPLAFPDGGDGGIDFTVTAP
jgi:hypothetical protein